MTWLIPPRLVLMLCIIMAVFTYFVPIRTLFVWPWQLLGLILCLVGVAMVFAIAKRFSRVETEINTFKTPLKLQTDGLFGISRNPIYLGMLIFLIGVAITCGSLAAWTGPIVFFLFANHWYIPVEETNAEASFGTPYLKYKTRVRRWL